MITKEEFIKLIDDYKDWANQLDMLDEILGHQCSLEIPVIAYGQSLFDTILRRSFDGAGVDTIEWWLYEFVDKVITYPDGTKVTIKTAEDLWEIVKDYIIAK